MGEREIGDCRTSSPFPSLPSSIRTFLRELNPLNRRYGPTGRFATKTMKYFADLPIVKIKYQIRRATLRFPPNLVTSCLSAFFQTALHSWPPALLLVCPHARPLARPTANFANPFGSEIVVVVVVFGSGFWRSAKNASMTRPFYVKRRRRAADATRE